MRIRTVLFIIIQVFAFQVFAQDLGSIRTFAYQLQAGDVQTLAASPYDLIISDYSRDGSEASRFTLDEVNQIKTGKTGRKLVAYLSIGEAEDYRFYFKNSWLKKSRRGDCPKVPSISAPQWLGPVNANFCGNYKVRFWQASWQKIIFGVPSGNKESYLDRIIDGGFDGVYLDIIDGFRFWDKEEGNGERPRAARDMAKFVIALSSHARIKRGHSDFVIIPQNGSDIIEYLTPALKTQYFAAINGIGAEDTFYFGNKDENNNLNVQDYTISYLQQYLAAGKPVFAIDYLTEEAKILDFHQRACQLGFIPQVGKRALDSLIPQRDMPCQ